MREFNEKSFEPNERAQEKQLSRERDEHDLASGAKSRDQLRAENGHFSRLSIRPNFGAAKALS